MKQEVLAGWKNTKWAVVGFQTKVPAGRWIAGNPRVCSELGSFYALTNWNSLQSTLEIKAAMPPGESTTGDTCKYEHEQNLGTFLHISIQHLIEQLLLDSRRQVLYICKRHMGEILCFHALCKLMVRSTEGNRTATIMTHRGDVLCSSIHWLTFCQWHTVNTSSVQHVVFLCVLNCAHTKPEHWWLFSGSIVNGTGFVWKGERETEWERPAAGLGPDSVRKRNTWHSREKINSNLSVKPA